MDDGMFTLGGYDVERFGYGKGPKIEWLPIMMGGTQEEKTELKDKKTSFQSNSHWLLEMPTILLNDTQVPIDNKVAMLDTGSSYIRVPASDFDRLQAVLNDSFG